MEETKLMKKRRFISLLLAALISLSPILCAMAAPEGDSATTTVTSPDGTTKTVGADDESAEDGEETDESSSDTHTDNQESAAAGSQLEAGVTMEDPTLTPPDVSHSKSALLMDLPSGRVLYSKNLDERVFPASTTKIMTGILALEMGNMADVVTVPYEALKNITLEDSQMGLLTGEQLTMEQLLNSMLVYSANDAANVIAIQVSGSIDAFVETMNNKAKELGMTGTNFVNPCGSHDDNHYTTARDLAIITKYAMKNEQFREIVKKPIYTVPATNKNTKERPLVNTNLFLGTSRSTHHYYPPATGIKTGHTSQSGYCLVASAAYNETELLSIVMGCDNVDTKGQAYSYIDSKNLFEFGFDNYQHLPLAKAGDIISDSKVSEAKDDMRVAVTVESDVSALIPNKSGSADEIQTDIDMPEKLYAPIAKGDVLGTVTYTYKGIPIGTGNLVATNDVERNNIIHFFNMVLKVITSPLFFIPVIILILIFLFARHQKKKRERKRRIQQLKHGRAHSAPANETGTRTPDRNASRTERVSRETRGSNSRYKK